MNIYIHMLSTPPDMHTHDENKHTHTHTHTHTLTVTQPTHKAYSPEHRHATTKEKQKNRMYAPSSQKPLARLTLPMRLSGPDASAAASPALAA